jgi:hypothetical protein
MNKQTSYKASIAQSLMLFATIMLMTTASAQAATVIYKLTAVLDASNITDKKVNSADFGFGPGDILSTRISIDSQQLDLNSDTEIGIFENGTLDLSFTITSSNGAVIYSSTTTTSNDTELKLEDNHDGKHDKIELTDESGRTAIYAGSDVLPFDKFKVKLQDDTMSALTSIVPDIDEFMVIGDWGNKNEYEIKWKDGGDYVKLKGEFDSLRVVPIPAAAWLFGSALLALFTISRRRTA